MPAAPRGPAHSLWVEDRRRRQARVGFTFRSRWANCCRSVSSESVNSGRAFFGLALILDRSVEIPVDYFLSAGDAIEEGNVSPIET